MVEKLFTKENILFKSVCYVIFILLVTEAVSTVIRFEYNVSLLITELVATAITLFIIYKQNDLVKLKFEAKTFWKGLLVCWYPILLAALILLPKLNTLDYTRLTIGYTLIIIFANFMVGAFEEPFFRILIFSNLLSEYSPFKAGITSAVIFGVVHGVGIFKGRPVIQVSSQVLYAFFLGVFFAALFYKYRNIWPLIFVHGLTDTASGIIKITVEKNVPLANATVMQELMSNLTNVMFVFPLFVAGLVMFYRIKKEESYHERKVKGQS